MNITCNSTTVYPWQFATKPFCSYYVFVAEVLAQTAMTCSRNETRISHFVIPLFIEHGNPQQIDNNSTVAHERNLLVSLNDMTGSFCWEDWFSHFKSRSIWVLISFTQSSDFTFPVRFYSFPGPTIESLILTNIIGWQRTIWLAKYTTALADLIEVLLQCFQT